MRGEDPEPLLSSFFVAETPPRAWGRRPNWSGQQVIVGNTPTCVGKTVSALRENSFPVETPPRAWGRQPHLHAPLCGRRNTPTCVGKSPFTSRRAWIPRKHPHVRGEDSTVIDGAEKTIETPPRAWGRPNDAEPIVRKLGNTPTCVGKTQRIRRFRGFPQKHPHVRGEDIFLRKNPH